ncbi:unnamed protein product, partial [marine sediment metagenome]
MIREHKNGHLEKVNDTYCLKCGERLMLNSKQRLFCPNC